MTATLAQVMTRTRDRLNEASARHWTEPQLRRWINEGAADIARRTECLLAKSTINITAGARSISLASLSPQPIRLHRAEYSPGSTSQFYPLEYRDYSLMDDVWGTSQALTSGTPQYFTAWGFFPSMTLYVYPAAASAGVITLYYYRLPTARSESGTDDGLTVEVPDGWEDLVADYAEMRALRNDSNPRWAESRGIYEEKVNAMIAMTTRPVDGVGMYVGANGFVPGWLASGD